MNIGAIYKNYDQLCELLEARKPYTKPACFIRGGKSKYLDESDFPAIKKIFPKAEIVTIPSAGHWVHIDAPERFTEIVVNFLNRNDN